MKKTVRVLFALWLSLIFLCACAFAAQAEQSPSSLDQAADDPAADELLGDEAFPDDEPAADEAPAEAAPLNSVNAVSELVEPQVRWSYVVSLTTLQSPYLTLVNEENKLGEDFEPAPLVKMTSVKRATSATIYLQEAAAKAVEDMFEAALQVKSYTYMRLNSKGNETEDTAKYSNGMTLFLKSGYRKYGTQATTYANYLARNNNVDDGYVAKPGASEHQSGLCCDILNADYAARDYMTQDFKYTPEAQWMKEHCAEFGMILRFTEDGEAATGIKFEPWHFRYVGKEAAGYISSTGMTLEEFTAEWQKELSDFEARGGDIAEQLAYEDSRLNAPPASYVLDETGADGDAEVSLVF